MSKLFVVPRYAPHSSRQLDYCYLCILTLAILSGCTTIKEQPTSGPTLNLGSAAPTYPTKKDVQKDESNPPHVTTGANQGSTDTDSQHDFPTQEQNPNSKPLNQSRHHKATQSIQDERILVNVDATKELKTGGVTGTLTVTITLPEMPHSPAPGKYTSSTIMNAISHTIKVKPNTSGISVDPTESGCIALHESGADIPPFTLTPPSAPGAYELSASVYFYQTTDCTGRYTPKTSTPITIQVSSSPPPPQGPNSAPVPNPTQSSPKFWDQLVTETKQAILKFWAEILGAIGLAVVGLLTGRIQTIFGAAPK